MTRHILATLLLLFVTLAMSAQSRISVKEETFDDMETTAMVNPEKDRNNRDCALVIFHNVEPDGYYFDAGSVYIKAENHTSRDNGEKTIFLYISEGAKLINIRHRNDGILSLRYEFANGPLQARHTYHVFLGTVVPANANAKQYLRFKITPVTASLEVEEQPGQFVPWAVDPATGMSAKFLPLGDYAYTVKARQYHSAAGKAEMTDGSKPLDEVVNLRPAFGTLEIASIGGATVSVDGENIAEYNVLRLDPGRHSVKISRPRYKLYQTEVKIDEGKTVRLSPKFVENFAPVNLRASAPDVTISLREGLRDRTLGVGSWHGELEAGDYIVVSTAPGHRESLCTISVSVNSEAINFALPAPTPVYGSININSQPIGAAVKIDGKDAGISPTLISDVLIGKHRVELSAPGKAPFIVTVDVPENGSCEVNAEMKDAEDVSALAHINKKTQIDESGEAQIFLDVEKFSDLPGFIVRPLGYNGTWDFKNSKKTLQSLNNYFKRIDGRFHKDRVDWIFAYSGSPLQDICDYKAEFISETYSQTRPPFICIIYTIASMNAYDYFGRYFSGVIRRHYVNSFETKKLARDKVNITVRDSVSEGKVTVSVFYWFDK